MGRFPILCGVEPRGILQTAIEESVPAIMSYSSKGKWHVARVILTELGASRLNIVVRPKSQTTGFDKADIQSERKPHPINLQINQPVGISFKYGYGKFIFDTSVIDFEPSLDSSNGETIVLSVPERIEVVQRRSYFRVEVPEQLSVNVVLWHRRGSVFYYKNLRNGGLRGESTPGQVRDMFGTVHHYYQGKLVDISAGGAQVVIADNSPAHGPDFKKGQFVGLRFTPLPYEQPITFTAQVRHIFPAEDGGSIYIGLQAVGLEACPEGRQVLARLVDVAERYHQINQSNARQLGAQEASTVL